MTSNATDILSISEIHTNDLIEDATMMGDIIRTTVDEDLDNSFNFTDRKQNNTNVTDDINIKYKPEITDSRKNIKQYLKKRNNTKLECEDKTNQGKFQIHLLLNAGQNCFTQTK